MSNCETLIRAATAAQVENILSWIRTVHSADLSHFEQCWSEARISKHHPSQSGTQLPTSPEEIGTASEIYHGPSGRQLNFMKELQIGENWTDKFFTFQEEENCYYSKPLLCKAEWSKKPRKGKWEIPGRSKPNSRGNMERVVQAPQSTQFILLWTLQVTIRCLWRKSIAGKLDRAVALIARMSQKPYLRIIRRGQSPMTLERILTRKELIKVYLIMTRRKTGLLMRKGSEYN